MRASKESTDSSSTVIALVNKREGGREWGDQDSKQHAPQTVFLLLIPSDVLPPYELQMNA